MFKVVDTRRNAKKLPFPQKRIRAANNPLRYVYFVTMALFMAYFKMRATKIGRFELHARVYCLFIHTVHTFAWVADLSKPSI